MSDQVERALNADEFRDVIGYFTSGVTVITAVDGDGRAVGTTASALCSLSLEPPMVLVCMNKRSTTGQALAGSGAFAINILSTSQSELAKRFATKDPEKFAGVAATAGPHGQPLLDDALAHLECSVHEEVEGSTHTVFLSDVLGATAHAGTPLAYFRGRFGRLDMADHDGAYQRLRAWVLEREDRWGRSIDVLTVGDELQIEPGALFHALGRLAADGLVLRRDDGSHIIAPITFEIVKSMMDARTAIELGVAQVSIGRIDDQALQTLRDAAEATIPLIDGSRFIDGAAYTAANELFHARLVGLAGSEALVDAYRSLDAAGMITVVQGRIPEESAVEGLALVHREIVEAFAARDRAAARKAIQHHAELALEMTRRAMEALPDRARAKQQGERVRTDRLANHSGSGQ